MGDLRIPDLGEGVDEGTVVALLVAVGSHFRREQPLLEIETEKVTLEIPAPCDGVIEELCVSINTVVRPAEIFARVATTAAAEIGGSVAAAGSAAAPVAGADSADRGDAAPMAGSVRADGGSEPTSVPADGGSEPTSVPAPPAVPTRSHVVPPPAAAQNSGERVIAAGPAARREARELGVELAAIAGSGTRQRITREDVRWHARLRLTATGTGGAPVSGDEALPDLAAFGPVHSAPLTRIEVATARNMARAARLIPQAWIEYRADITALEQARRTFRATQAAADAPVTMTAVLCKVVALALVEFPRFNAALDSRAQTLVYRDYVNIGVAVDAGRGLLVPVIKQADRRSVLEIAGELARLSQAARDHALAPATLRGAGITITNLGGLGVSGIQPIVSWPEVAIVGVAASEEILRQQAGALTTHNVLPLSLGFDHRVINGADAARFMRYIGELLANPAQLMFRL